MKTGLAEQYKTFNMAVNRDASQFTAHAQPPDNSYFIYMGSDFHTIKT